MKMDRTGSAELNELTAIPAAERTLMNRTAAGLTVIGIFSVILTGCGSSDPLAISCSAFMGKDVDTQITLATRWGAPNRDHIGPAERIAGPAYKDDLIRYCPNHPEAKLNELEVRITPA
jgi:hypothetical protein